MNKTNMNEKKTNTNSWSLSGKQIITSSMDWNIHLYEISSGLLLKRFEFGGPVLNVSLHPTIE